MGGGEVSEDSSAQPDNMSTDTNKDKKNSWGYWVIGGIALIAIHNFKLLLWFGISAAAVGLLMLLPHTWLDFDFVVQPLGIEEKFPIGSNLKKIEYQFVIFFGLSCLLIGGWIMYNVMERMIEKVSPLGKKLLGQRGFLCDWTEGMGTIKFLQSYGGRNEWQAISNPDADESLSSCDIAEVTGFAEDNQTVMVKKSP